jgi:hypothetical protein
MGLEVVQKTYTYLFVLKRLLQDEARDVGIILIRELANSTKNLNWCPSRFSLVTP